MSAKFNIKDKREILHAAAFITGMTFLISSLFLALLYSYPFFYTLFAVGSWLVLDWIDYELNKTSILDYFFDPAHKYAFPIFFVVATVFCFLVDYVYGVKVTGMWAWAQYSLVNYLIMYFFMNGAFILSMYELYQVLSTSLRGAVQDKSLFVTNIFLKNQDKLHNALLAVGIIFIVSPLYVYIFNTYDFIEYVMLLPFLGILFLTDSITHRLGGVTILSGILSFNYLKIVSLLITVFIGSFFTELVNLSGHEWEYLRMPFMYLKIFSIPMAVFIGWIPLVVSAISIVNMVKYAEAFLHKRRVAGR